jgi:hypothetical protein
MQQLESSATAPANFPQQPSLDVERTHVNHGVGEFDLPEIRVVDMKSGDELCENIFMELLI